MCGHGGERLCPSDLYRIIYLPNGYSREAIAIPARVMLDHRIVCRDVDKNTKRIVQKFEHLVEKRKIVGCLLPRCTVLQGPHSIVVLVDCSARLLSRNVKNDIRPLPCAVATTLLVLHFQNGFISKQASEFQLVLQRTIKTPMEAALCSEVSRRVYRAKCRFCSFDYQFSHHPITGHLTTELAVAELAMLLTQVMSRFSSTCGRFGDCTDLPSGFSYWLRFTDNVARTFVPFRITMK